MTNRIFELKQFFIVNKEHHKYRKMPVDKYELAKQFSKDRLTDLERVVSRMKYVLKHETPVLFQEERIAFTRTVTTIPEIHTKEEIQIIKEKKWIHEMGDVCNINVDYAKLLHCGFDEKKAEIKKYIEIYSMQNQEDSVNYLKVQIELLEAVQELADKYRELAAAQGNKAVAESLSQVPAKAPRSFLEALQMFRIIHFAMWCGRNYHNTIGRFDQYMYAYLQEDMKKGIYEYDTALELLEEFFLTFNRDSDLYPGIQQGDNGQSMVLGGLNEDGSDSYNLLSELCLKASLELCLIDPKINLRVHKNTPIETYILGTELTKQGLGFPQYSCDDVVIPGLMDLGYSKADAFNYVVAACWEFIIPGAAMDIPNVEALSFTKAVEDAIYESLEICVTYDDFAKAVHKQIIRQADELCDKVKDLYIFPAPFLSLMMEGCIEQAKDISLGSRYNNYGIHGTGVATAADSLAAIKKYIYEERSITKQDMQQALKNDFKGYEQVRNKLRYESPKMGNNIDYVDEIAVKLLAVFADALKGKRNRQNGIFRAGTGSAMYYLWHSKNTGATPDGRQRGEGIAANYSPSLFSRCKGPVSIIKSFAKPDLKRVVNGGPLTLELHETVFRTKDSMQKVAALVKSFMDLGGHQLQLNAVNRDTMLDAQKHPDNYRNLIVRVWGWSGYFVELDKEYQDHIIQRMELTM